MSKETIGVSIELEPFLHDQLKSRQRGRRQSIQNLSLAKLVVKYLAEGLMHEHWSKELLGRFLQETDPLFYAQLNTIQSENAHLQAMDLDEIVIMLAKDGLLFRHFLADVTFTPPEEVAP